MGKKNGTYRIQNQGPSQLALMVDSSEMQAITFPDLYEAAETAAARSQKKFLLERGFEFAALVAAASFGEIPRSSIGHEGPVIAFAFFALALILRVSGVGDRAEKRWYDARAAAESVKSASWQYSVGGESYRMSDQTADTRFIGALEEMLATLPDLDIGATPDSGPAITPEMRDLRNSAQSERARAYLLQRVQDQVRWYSQKAKWNKDKARLWRWILIAVQSSAVLLGGLRVLGVFDVNWLGILAAAAAGIAAWQQTKNFSSLSEAYAVTSHEVNLVSSTLDAEANDKDWAQSVHDAESAFSREHTLWRARVQGPRIV